MELTREEAVFVLSVIRWAWENGAVTGEGARTRALMLLQVEQKLAANGAAKKEDNHAKNVADPGGSPGPGVGGGMRDREEDRKA